MYCPPPFFQSPGQGGGHGVPALPFGRDKRGRSRAGRRVYLKRTVVPCGGPIWIAPVPVTVTPTLLMVSMYPVDPMKA